VTGLERLRRAFAFEPTDRVPVAPLLGAHAVRLAGLPFARAHHDAAVQAEALLRAVETYHPDGVFTLMDLSAEPEALGAQVSSRREHAPVVTRYLSPEQLLTEELEGRVVTGRVPVFLETVSRLRAALGDTVLVGALASGPITACANAIGIGPLARALRRDRGGVVALLDRLMRACGALVQRYARAGAHAVVLLEPVATSAILGPPDLEELLLPRLRAVSRAARQVGLLAALHVCGDCRASLPLLASAGFDALSLDAPVDLPAARAQVGRRVALLGNIEAHQLLRRGPASAVHAATAALVRAMGPGGGFVLSSGCELPADTPREHVQALLAAAGAGAWADPTSVSR
jgi:uroporphyrinogen decarboxylase